MNPFANAPIAGPTKDQYKLVKEVYGLTGILTVKDAETGHKYAPEYGKMFNPMTEGPSIRAAADKAVATGALGQAQTVGLASGGFGGDTFHRRAIWTRCIGTKKLPNGIPVGGYEIWRRNTPLELGGTDNELSVVDFRWDISTAEMERLEHWADDKVWVTNEMIDAADRERARVRNFQTETQQDPVGTVGKMIADALKSHAAPAMPSDEDMIAAGFVKGADGRWALAKPKAAPQKVSA